MSMMRNHRSSISTYGELTSRWVARLKCRWNTSLLEKVRIYWKKRSFNQIRLQAKISSRKDFAILSWWKLPYLECLPAIYMTLKILDLSCFMALRDVCRGLLLISRRHKIERKWMTVSASHSIIKLMKKLLSEHLM